MLLFPRALNSYSKCNNKVKVDIMNQKEEREKEKKPNLRKILEEREVFWQLVIFMG